MMKNDPLNPDFITEPPRSRTKNTDWIDLEISISWILGAIIYYINKYPSILGGILYIVYVIGAILFVLLVIFCFFVGVIISP